MFEQEYRTINASLVSITGYMTKMGKESKMAQLRKQLDNVRNSATTILVCGEFKRGKSTFINALIERNVCPTDVDICTSIASVIKYGPKQKAIRAYGDFSNIRYQEIDFDDIQVYTVGTAEEIGNTIFIEIELPLEELKKGLVIIDTPGVGGIDPRHALLTNYFLPQADVTLFMTDVNEPLSTTELDFYKNKVLQYAKRNVIIVNKADLKNSQSVEEIRQDTINKVSVYAQTTPESLDVISVSAADCIRQENGLGNFPKLRTLLDILVNEFKAEQYACIRDDISEQISFIIMPLQAQLNQIESPSIDQIKELTSQKTAIDEKLKELQNPSSDFRRAVSEKTSIEWEMILADLNEACVMFMSEGFNKLLKDKQAKAEGGCRWLGQQINDAMEALGSEIMLKMDKAFGRIAKMKEFDGLLNFKIKDYNSHIVIKDTQTSLPLHRRIMPLTSGLGVAAIGNILLSSIPVVGWLAALGLGTYVAIRNLNDTVDTHQESLLRQIYQPQIAAATQNLRTYVENRFIDFQREWIQVVSDRAKEFGDTLKQSIEDIQSIKQKISDAVNQKMIIQKQLAPLMKVKSDLDAIEF